MPIKPPRAERIAIPGPAGALEALVETPEERLDSAHFGVICHPHPLHGGTMHNKVAHTLARAMHDLGVATVRFNFRGVGTSAGAFDEGIGEVADALAAVTWGQERWPGARLWLAGFSFGGVVAIRAAARIVPERLITVAPAVTRIDVRGEKLPACPWLLVQGDADEVIAPQVVLDWAARLEPRPQLAVMPEVGHYFHGHLNELRDAATAFLRDAQAQAPYEGKD